MILKQRHVFYALASCLIVVALGCNGSGSGGDMGAWQGLPTGASIATPSRVHGVITNQNGEPIEGAAVSALVGTTTVALVTSAGDGSFALSLSAGSYILSVAKAGYAISRQSLTLRGVEDRLVVATLGPQSTMTGKVLLSTTKELLPNIDVRIYDATGLLIDSTRSNIEGVFTFQDLAIGRYDVSLAAQSTTYAPATYVVQILNDGTLSPSNPQLLVSLRGQESRVHGIVNSPTGLPVAGAAVSIISGVTPLTIASTGNDGTFSLQAPPGTYTLNVAMAGYAVFQQGFTVGTGEDRLIMVTLGPRSTVRGTVLLASTREPLPNINVIIYDIVGARRDATKTNVEGVFVFQDLAVGRYNVALAPETTTYGAATYTFQILNDGTVVPAAPEFLMTSIGVQGKLRGTITNINGQAISGASIQIASGASVIAIARSAADGSFSVQTSVGTYTLSVSMTDYGLATQDNVSVTGGNDPITVITLGPRTSVTGRVMLNTNREALPNIDVTITGPLNAAIPNTATTLTNISGYFTSENLAPGNYRIALALGSPQYVPATFTFQVLGNGTVSPTNQEYLIARQVVTQQATLALATGTIRDAYSLAPLEYVTCTMRGVGNTSTDNLGRFSFSNLQAGAYELTFSRSGWDALTVSFNVQAATAGLTLVPSKLDFVLTQTVDINRGSLSGRYYSPVGIASPAYAMLYRYTLYDIYNASGTLIGTEWSLDARSPAPVVTTQVGQDLTTTNSTAGTFRLTNLTPTTDRVKYIVAIMASTTPFIASGSPTFGAAYFHMPTVGTQNIVHYWSFVEIQRGVSTFLTNWDLPNFAAPSRRRSAQNPLDIDFDD